MSESDPIVIPKVNYHCREHYYGLMEMAANEGLQKYGNDPVLKYLRGYAMILQDRVQEGMRDLDLLKDKRDVNLGSTLALMYGHKRSSSVDKETLQQLDAKLKEERKQSGEMGLYYAGLILFYAGKHDKAREYIDRMLKMIPSSVQGLVLKGWIEMTCGRDALAKKALKFFDDAIGHDGARDIDALLGKAKYFEMRRNYNAALEHVNQVIVAHPEFTPALIEKMKLQLALQDWEQCVETAQRALSHDIHNLEAQKHLILNLLCREGNYKEACDKLGELLQNIDRFESRNGELYKTIAELFGRMCGRNSLILQQTCTFVERAVSTDSNNAKFVTELGFQLFAQGKVKDSLKVYHNAMKLDESSVEALTGIIRCQLVENQLEEAAQQLEFLNEVQQSIGRSAELSYLSAMLAQKKNEGSDKVLQLLNEAIEAHFAGLKGVQLGASYFYVLNPDFLLQVLRDYMQFAPQQPVSPGQPVNPILKRCSQVLDPLVRTVPGLLEALFMMGKVKFLAGDIESAQATLQHCLEQDPAYADAHVLMAQIHLYQDNFKMANQSLEMGLSHNFEVRDHPLYHLIKARIYKKQKCTEEAIKTLKIAMGLPGVKTLGGRSSAGRSRRVQQISVNDRVSVFLELAEAHRILGEQHEATRVMQDATNTFMGTPEEIRITIANADLSLVRGDIEMALGMLRNITPDQPYFVEAKEKMADIYLHHRKDKRLYANCYRELVDKQHSPHTCLLLGDAYMSIQEPEKAIEVYETALRKNPRDAALASKIGKALVKTHNYGKAISYYEAALKSGGQAFLRYDLAELLLKMSQFDKAEKVLKQALDTEGLVMELDGMIDQARYLVLLSKVYEKTGKAEDAILSLTKARDVQSRVLKRVHVEQPDGVATQKQLATNLCSQMAHHYAEEREYEKAIKCYKDALTYCENDAKVMLDLAGIYLTTQDLDACQHQLMTLLRNEKENDDATIMLADLMFHKDEYDSAMFHFQQLLERRPDHYEALVKLIDLMRRAGKLDETARFIELAEKSSTRTGLEAGFNYCKGLYEWLTGNSNTALLFLNKARRDSDWGYRAMVKMIEICMNPDSATIGGEVFETMEADNAHTPAEREKADSDQMALRTAEKLLKEVKVPPGDTKLRWLENMVMINSKHNKPGQEKALNLFLDMAAADTKAGRENIQTLYGIAAAHMLLKQIPRARNQLKRLTKFTWTMENAEELEKSWILLIDIFIQNNKFDMATDLIKRCLQHNKSCWKAYEYRGYVMEKEQQYKEASLNYESAWKYGNRSPVIGYKLAFNYMKAKRYSDAIEICHHVLTTHPNYPKIRKDILEKARASIRT